MTSDGRSSRIRGTVTKRITEHGAPTVTPDWNSLSPRIDGVVIKHVPPEEDERAGNALIRSWSVDRWEMPGLMLLNYQLYRRRMRQARGEFRSSDQALDERPSDALIDTNPGGDVVRSC